MNIFQKIIYLILQKKDKQLEKNLLNQLKTSASNKTSKTVIGENITMTFSAETERNKELVLNSVTKLVTETKAKQQPLG